MSVSLEPRVPFLDFRVRLAQRARQRGLNRMAPVENMGTSESASGRQIWGLQNIELWHREFIDGERN